MTPIAAPRFSSATSSRPTTRTPDCTAARSSTSHCPWSMSSASHRAIAVMRSLLRSSTMWGRCASRTRSSTSGERLPQKSARSSKRTRSRASACSTVSAAYSAASAGSSAPVTSATTGQGIPTGSPTNRFRSSLRIVACCDAFNAMTTDRPYRAALPHSEAVAELERNRGTQFDPRVVDALMVTLERRESAGAPLAAASA